MTMSEPCRIAQLVLVWNQERDPQRRTIEEGKGCGGNEQRTNAGRYSTRSNRQTFAVDSTSPVGVSNRTITRLRSAGGTRRRM